MKTRIYLDTMSDIKDFVDAVSEIEEDVFLEDGTGYKVSAKSMLFTAVAKMEWKELWVTCVKDISGKLFKWTRWNWG